MNKLTGLISISLICSFPVWAENSAAESTQRNPVKKNIDSSSQPKNQAADSNLPTGAPVAIDCNYKVTGAVEELPQKTLVEWANYAAAAAFDYDYENIDKKLSNLKPCFTKSGWQSFNKAMTKSGNIAAIKEQQLSVNSSIKGKTLMVDSTPKEWKITVPLTVNYVSKEQSMAQQLKVTLNVGVKLSGDLGINQVIATTDDAVTKKFTVKNRTSQTPTNATKTNKNNELH